MRCLRLGVTAAAVVAVAVVVGTATLVSEVVVVSEVVEEVECCRPCLTAHWRLYQPLIDRLLPVEPRLRSRRSDSSRLTLTTITLTQPLSRCRTSTTSSVLPSVVAVLAVRLIRFPPLGTLS